MATYHLYPSGLNDTPFVQAAYAAAVNAGDKVIWHAGAYPYNVMLTKGGFEYAAPANGVITEGDGYDATKINIQTTGMIFDTDFPVLFYLNGKTNCEFRKFSIYGGRGLGWTIGGTTGILWQNGSGHIAEDIKIYDMDGDFISVAGATGCRISRYKQIMTRQVAPSGASHGLNHDSTPSNPSDGTIVEDCELDNFGGDAFKIENTSTVTFRRNKVYSNASIAQDSVGWYFGFNSALFEDNEFYSYIVLNNLKVGGGTGHLTCRRNKFMTDAALIYGVDATAANYGTMTIEYNDFRGENSYSFPAGVVPVVAGNKGIKGGGQTPSHYVHMVATASPGKTSGINPNTATRPYLSTHSPATAIMSAVTDAETVAGDHVKVADGTYYARDTSANRNINCGGKAIVIRAANDYAWIMDGTGDTTAANAISSGSDPAGAMIVGFYAKNFTNGNSRAVNLASTTALKCARWKAYNCISANTGGGARIDSASASIEDYEINSCSTTSASGGGGLYMNAAAAARRGKVINCTAPSNGAVRLAVAGSTVDVLEVSGTTVTMGVYASAAGAHTVQRLVGNNNAGGDFTIANGVTVTGDNHILRSTTALTKVGTGALNANNSDIRGGGATGANNIDSDPLWKDAANGDFTLLDGSPCATTGLKDWTDGAPVKADITRAPFHPLYTSMGTRQWRKAA